MRSTHFDEGDHHHSSESHVRVKVTKSTTSSAKRAKSGMKVGAKQR